MWYLVGLVAFVAGALWMIGVPVRESPGMAVVLAVAGLIYWANVKWGDGDDPLDRSSYNTKMRQ